MRIMTKMIFLKGMNLGSLGTLLELLSLDAHSAHL